MRTPRSASRQPVTHPHRSRVKPGDGASTQASGAGQRERLVNAMIELAAEEGFRAVSVAEVSSQAGVSSATFYELFRDKEDCLLAAYEAITEGLFDQLRGIDRDGRVSTPNWSVASVAALDRMLRAVQADPNRGRILFIEALGGRGRIREARKRVLSELESLLEKTLDRASREGHALDIPPIAVIGGVRSIVARRLRTSEEDDLPALAREIVSWMDSYTVSANAPPWSTGSGALLPEIADAGAPARAQDLDPLPRGRHGLPPGAVARSQRLRIIHATAEVTMDKGYADATVADIVAAARVSRDAFYAHFTDKEHAFLEAQQHPTRHILDTCADAYFSARAWPERIWRFLGTLLEMIAENPAISHLRLVECYAAGPSAIRRAEEITRSFNVFLREGYSYRPEATTVRPVFSEAIAGAVYELVQRDVARSDGAGLLRRLPLVAYIVLAPFTGADEAIETIEQFKANHPALAG
jgi:AcrR family transcriptional regulator